MSYDHIYLKTLYIQGGLDTVIHYMERGGLLRDTGRVILGETGGQMPGSILRAMGVHTRFGSHDGDRALSAGASKTGGQLQIEKLVADGLSVGRRRARSNTQDLEGTSPIQGQLRL